MGRTRKLIIGMVIVLFVATTTVLAYLYIHVLEEERFQQNVVENCQKNGNPLRRILSKRLERELHSLKTNRPIFEKAFTGLSPEELAKLVLEDREHLRQEIKEAEPRNCESLSTH